MRSFTALSVAFIAAAAIAPVLSAPVATQTAALKPGMTNHTSSAAPSEGDMVDEFLSRLDLRQLRRLSAIIEAEGKGDKKGNHAHKPTSAMHTPTATMHTPSATMHTPSATMHMPTTTMHPSESQHPKRQVGIPLKIADEAAKEVVEHEKHKHDSAPAPAHSVPHPHGNLGGEHRPTARDIASAFDKAKHTVEGDVNKLVSSIKSHLGRSLVDVDLD